MLEKFQQATTKLFKIEIGTQLLKTQISLILIQQCIEIEKLFSHDQT